MVAYALPSVMITIREYLDLRGRSPFDEWFECLNAPTAAEDTTTLVGNEQGHFSNTGVSEQASMNAGVISAPNVESTSEKTETRSLF